MSDSADLLAKTMHFLQESLYYGAKLTTWRTVEHMTKTAVAAAIGIALAGKLSKVFKSGVDTESVVGCETYFEYTGERNPKTQKNSSIKSSIRNRPITLEKFLKKPQLAPLN